MAIEPTPPPHPENSKLDLTQGPLNWKKAQPFMILTGVIVLGGLAIHSFHLQHEQPAKPTVATTPTPANNPPQPPPRTPVKDLMDGSPAGTPVPTGTAVATGAGGYAYAPQETPEQQMERERKKKMQDLEDSSAFASSLVASEKTTSRSDQPAAPSPEPRPKELVENATKNEKPVDPFAFDLSQPLVWLPEHTIINAVLDSKVDGEFTGPIDAHVSMPVYTHDGQLVFPQGTMLFGTADKVSQFGLNRIAIVFHKAMVYPSTGKPYSVSLDQNTPGMGQEGTPGLDGKVNNHFWSTFGAASAVGLISGISLAGSYNSGAYSPQVGIYQGISQSVSQSTDRVLERYLSRMPTITIQPGKRMLVELVTNLQAPTMEKQ